MIKTIKLNIFESDIDDIIANGETSLVSNGCVYQLILKGD